MSNKKVLILGASGMLGSMVTDFLSRQNAYCLAATVRSESLAERGKKHFPNILWRVFDVEEDGDDALADMAAGSQWIINCVGKTKPYTHDDNAEEIERAIKVNSLFPYRLASAAAKKGSKVLSIATDCVFSGITGDYGERDKHDALDVYGKTKSLGECYMPNAFSLRCSIIGPESKSYVFLLEWFRQQAKGAQVNGFTNHLWNGMTTLHFAKICHGIIKNDLDLPHIQHVIPSGTISKSDLLKCFADGYKRPDITITPVEAATVVNRVLATEHPDLNEKLWRLAGYESPPTVAAMVAEMARFDFRMEAVFS
jgi:dTDP-4-dehydrorhamnose reductase